MKLGDQIKQMLLNGDKYNIICNALQVAKSTVAYHAKKLELNRGTSFERKLYDWVEIQKYYDEGYCLAEVAEHFNLKYENLQDGKRSGKLKTVRNRVCKNKLVNNEKISNDRIFVENSIVDTPTVKRRIIKYNFLDYKCHIRMHVSHF